jgi:putative Holliday junction resolvase
MARLSPDRYLCLDVGERRIGVAVGSLDTGLAEPLEVIVRTGDDGGLARRLRELVKREDTGTVVIGDPLNMDGSSGDGCERSRRFAKWLKSVMRQVRVVLYDERLSSFTADERMEREGLKRSRRKEMRDAYAAAAILLEYWNAKREEPDADS